MDAPRRCIVCDRAGPFTDVWRSGDGRFRLVRCECCGLVFQDPQPGEGELEHLYYHDPEFSQLLIGPLREFTLSRAREKLHLLREAGAVRSGGRVLDVGCSSGAWLEVAASAGMIPQGVEPGETTSEEARARGLDVRTGTLESCFADAEDRFDLITFWDVLEHLRDPLSDLALAAELLSEHGLVAATFPNVEGWYPRLTYRLLARRLGVWEYAELPVHLYDFGPQTARRLFERAGFKVRALRTIPVPFYFYRSTVLSLDSLGGGMKARAARAAFETLKFFVYPAARVFDRQNALFLVASR